MDVDCTSVTPIRRIVRGNGKELFYQPGYCIGNEAELSNSQEEPG